jgi:hypothetical protein
VKKSKGFYARNYHENDLIALLRSPFALTSPRGNVILVLISISNPTEGLLSSIRFSFLCASRMSETFKSVFGAVWSCLSASDRLRLTQAEISALIEIASQGCALLARAVLKMGTGACLPKRYDFETYRNLRESPN